MNDLAGLTGPRNQQRPPGWTDRVAEDRIRRILLDADIRINGDRPWDLQVHDPSFFRRVLLQSSLAFGETYTEGLWDANDLEEVFRRLLRAATDRSHRGLAALGARLRAWLLNLQTPLRSRDVARVHYDLGNDLYEAMLDRRMIYTCAYWRDARNLDEAQEHKLRLCCEKLGLEPGMRVLDIGCGWGGLARYAAEHYGVHVTGVTISEEQAALARERCEGLPVDIQLRDYRDIEGEYDRIVSLGMFEHVGHKNYRAYMEVVAAHLAPKGSFLLQTIGKNESVVGVDPWIDRYIFPNGEIPSLHQITEAVEGRFVIEDMHNFGPDYARTLRAWYTNFRGNWHKLRGRYGEQFFRVWRYYLLSCAGAFSARNLQLWQILMNRGDVNRTFQRP